MDTMCKILEGSLAKETYDFRNLKRHGINSYIYIETHTCRSH